MKRLLTVQDISCVGKCSLTVALPVISACGVETSVLPTALLSTHTAFGHFSFYDLTPQFAAIINAWRAENLRFDALYSGYLGSAEQIRAVSDVYAEFCADGGFLFVDPVMADHGKLYPGFADSFAGEMAKLCAKADYIVPNISEACFLLDRPYPAEGYTKADIESLLRGLAALGAKTAVITGVSLSADKVGVMAYVKETESFFEYYTEKLPVSFPGTGDVFASAAVGALTHGIPLENALRAAADFTLASIRATCRDADKNWYGVNFETELPQMIRAIKDNAGL